MGNRGILHDAEGRLGRKRWTSSLWITCALAFKGRARKLMSPGSYTELFFLDEAVAFAAGHRPCAECRRADYNRFRSAWAAAGLGSGQKAHEIDTCLHAARLTGLPSLTGWPRRQARHPAALAGLPDGSFILWQGAGHLVLGARLHPYAPGGYGPPLPRPATGEAVAVLTPAPLIATLMAGYRPVVHPSAA